MNCGVDIIEVKRIADVIRRNKSFLSRVFTRQEISYCTAKKMKWQHFAVRFAAKEAVWKSLGNSGIALKDIGIKNNPDGKPVVVIQGKHRGLARRVCVSLSHTEHYAVAMAIYTAGTKAHRH
jgi:holo-[acyl-carrier protein] synthase